jgi:hypothetical protein
MTQAGKSQQPALVQNVETEQAARPMPAAGPHARPELTNYEACPGAGALPSENQFGRESDPGAG